MAATPTPLQGRSSAKRETLDGPVDAIAGTVEDFLADKTLDDLEALPQASTATRETLSSTSTATREGLSS